MTAPVLEAVQARTLVDPALFTRLSKRVMTKHSLPQDDAEQIVDQTLAYLAACATKPAGTPMLYMSPDVDKGWHPFLEYTRPYDDFFASHGWQKVQHNPCDAEGETYPPAAQVLPLTVAAIEQAGYVALPHLWQDNRVDCGDTCGDDGQPGNPPDCGHQI